MTDVSRRLLLSGLAAAAAFPAMAADKTKVVPLKKLFPYLDAYYALPAASRTRFELVYRTTIVGAGAAGLRVAYVGAGERVAAALGPDGRILRLPSLAMLKGGYKAELIAPDGAKVSLDMQVEPSLRPAAEMDARELAAAVRQAADGVRKSAGVFGFAAPKMERVVFRGGQGGVLVTAAGRTAPLAVVKGSPVFDPTPDARWVRFTRRPTSMVIGPAK